MVEAGKDTGPILIARFKICAAGCSDFHGLILGGRALDSPRRGGLGFRPGPNTHVFDGLGGIQMVRKESIQPRPDQCYAIRVSLADSALDSDDGVASDASASGDSVMVWYSAPGPTYTGGSAWGPRSARPSSRPRRKAIHQGTALTYAGEPIVLMAGDGALVPVARAVKGSTDGKLCEVVVPAAGAAVEVVSGLWDTNGSDNESGADVELECGDVVL